MGCSSKHCTEALHLVESEYVRSDHIPPLCNGGPGWGDVALDQAPRRKQRWGGLLCGCNQLIEAAALPTYVWAGPGVPAIHAASESANTGIADLTGQLLHAAIPGLLNSA